MLLFKGIPLSQNYLEVAAKVQEGGDLLGADGVRVEEVSVANVQKVVTQLRWWRLHKLFGREGRAVQRERERGLREERKGGGGERENESATEMSYGWVERGKSWNSDLYFSLKS